MRSNLVSLRTAVIGAGMLTALAACKPAETRDVAEYFDPAEVARADGVPAESASQTANAGVPKVGDSYWTARKALVAAGFTPVNTTTEGRTVCVTAMEEAREISLDQCPGETVLLPEVEDCAGTGMGNCLTRWRAPDGRNLTINTVDGPQPGVVSGLEWSPAGGPVGQN